MSALDLCEEYVLCVTRAKANKKRFDEQLSRSGLAAAMLFELLAQKAVGIDGNSFCDLGEVDGDKAYLSRFKDELLKSKSGKLSAALLDDDSLKNSENAVIERLAQKKLIFDIENGGNVSETETEKVYAKIRSYISSGTGGFIDTARALLFYSVKFLRRNFEKQEIKELKHLRKTQGKSDIVKIIKVVHRRERAENIIEFLFDLIGGVLDMFVN